MSELDEKALRELLAEIAERLRFAHGDLAVCIASGDTEAAKLAQEDFELIGAQHRLLLLQLAHLKPGGRKANGRAPDADASAAT